MSSAPESKRAPRVEVGTALAESEAKAQAWADAVAATTLDPGLWSGAFGTNVWGGRYEMDGVLAQGGQGCTFLGTDSKTGARVVAKVLDLKHTADWKRVELFEREAKTLREVEHAGMPQLLEVLTDEETGARALVMTHVPGDDLQRVLRQDGPLSEASLWRVLVDVVDVLRALHGAPSPILHRDIKPRNLVRRPDGGVSVVDFGGVGSTRQGEASTVVGTFGYIAPEQLYGQASEATDLYALGATLLTLATGKEPEDQPRAGLAIDVTQAAPHLSEPLRRLLGRMLSPDPGARPRDARALSQELEALYDESRQGGRVRAAETWSEGFEGWQARWDAYRRSPEHQRDLADVKAEVDTGVDLLAGFVTVLLGVLGTLATVVIGEVLLPVILSIAMSVASGDGKKRLGKAKEAVLSGARGARQGFKGTLASGVTQMKGAAARRQSRLPRKPPGASRGARQKRAARGR